MSVRELIKINLRMLNEEIPENFLQMKSSQLHELWAETQEKLRTKPVEKNDESKLVLKQPYHRDHYITYCHLCNEPIRCYHKIHNTCFYCRQTQKNIDTEC